MRNENSLIILFVVLILLWMFFTLNMKMFNNNCETLTLDDINNKKEVKVITTIEPTDFKVGYIPFQGYSNNCIPNELYPLSEKAPNYGCDKELRKPCEVSFFNQSL